MIVGIGCDIVDNTITSKLNWGNDFSLINRIFSETEINLCPENDSGRYYSGRFAIKEAILKCLYSGMQDGISLKDIELTKANSGSIKANLNGNIKKIADRLQITTWHISLSHSSGSSIAFVVAERE